MKKLFATLLALAMLAGFAVVGIAADAQPNDDLQQQGYVLTREVTSILTSGEFTLRGRGTPPFGTTLVSLVIVSDNTNQRMAIETSIHWPDAISNRFFAFGLRTLLGNRARVLMDSSGSTLIFPSRCVFITMHAEAGFEYDFWLGFEPIEILSETLDVAEVIVDGRTYLRTTFENPYNNALTHYFFYNEQLRRLETISQDEHFLFLIDDLSGTADENIFHLRRMLRISLNWLARIPIT